MPKANKWVSPQEWNYLGPKVREEALVASRQVRLKGERRELLQMVEAQWPNASNAQVSSLAPSDEERVRERGQRATVSPIPDQSGIDRTKAPGFICAFPV